MIEHSTRSRPLSDLRLTLKTDFASLSSGAFVAIQVDAGPNRRQFVVATDDEARRGWIPNDRRPRYLGLHPAFDAAHRLASRTRAARRAA